MFSRKTFRKFAWGTGAFLLVLGILYSLRWTLFEGLVKNQIREKARKELQSDVLFGKLEGSLLFDIHATTVILVPREGSLLKKASFGEIHIEYGLFGMGDPEITIDGARVVLAPPEAGSSSTSGPPADPPYKIIQSVLKEVSTFELPGRIHLQNATLVLANGTEIGVSKADFLENSWDVHLWSEKVGNVDVQVKTGGDPVLELKGKAFKGPIRWIQFSLGRREGEIQECSLLTEYMGHRIAVNGKIHFREGDSPYQVEGNLVVREGTASGLIDFEKGTGIVDLDAVLPLEEELEGLFQVTGHGEGPLDGTAEEWIFSNVRISSKKFYFQSVPFDRLEIRVPQGQLSHLSWEGELVNNEDRITAEGSFHWGNPPRVKSNLRAKLKQVEPYLPLFPPLAALHTTDLHVNGEFNYTEQGPLFDGTVRTGKGRAYAFDWNALHLTGRFDRNSANLRKLTVNGTPIANQIDASGKISSEGDLSGQLRTDEDRIDITGRISKESGVWLEYELQGPMRWLETFNINIPEEARPFYFNGSAKGRLDQVQVRTAITAGDLLSAAATVQVSRKGGLWNLELSPGSVLLRGREQVEYGTGRIQVRPGYLSLSEVPLAIRKPALRATVWAEANWDREQMETHLHLKETNALGTELGTIRAFAGYRKESGNIQIELDWGTLDADHLIARGIFGESNDFDIQFRIRDLDTPAIHHLFPEVPLTGEVALQVKVRQEGDQVTATGKGFTIKQATIHHCLPFSLAIPVTSGTNSLTIPETTQKVPYGKLTLSGKVPLPWTRYAGDLDLAATLEAPSFAPLFQHFPLPEDMEEPRAEAIINATVMGSITHPVAHLRAEIDSERSPLPPPLGELTQVHLIIEYDGKRFQLVDGTGKVGGGPFHLSGEWTVSEPSHPLRLRLRGEELLAVQDPLARIRINPDVELRWNPREGCRIAGNVDVPLALYYREFGPRSEVVPARTGEAVIAGLRLPPSPEGGFFIPGIEGLPETALDLHIRTTDECRIENSEIGVLIDGNVRMRGTIEKPALSGTLKADRGEIKLSTGIFLKINSAHVQLPAQPGEEGTLQFNGTIGQGEGRISVVLSGPISLPRLNLQSHPPRTQQELLAQVAFGQAPGALSDTGALKTLAVKVVEQITDDWPRADPSESFFDQFKLTIVDEDLTVTPWELPPIGTAQGTRVRTEYVLNSYFSIIAETDDKGNVSGDLKVRLNFR